MKAFPTTTLVCATAMFGFDMNANAQTQKGLDIDGVAEYDYFGGAVSMPDVNTVAIGAHLNDETGLGAGEVRIYTWNGSAWMQKGVDLNGAEANDNFGLSVSMPDPNTVAIGAPHHGSYAGQVRIFSWSGSAWVQKGIDIDGEAIHDWSGFSVSMPDTNTVAIGAIGNDGNGAAAGHVRIYVWSGSAWVQKGVDLNGEAADDGSGWSVSMPDPNTVAISARYNDGSASNAGHVRVYTWSGTTWIQKGLDIDGEAAEDWSSDAVSMPDPNTVAIGSYRNAGIAIEGGDVRVYAWSGTAWVQKGNDIEGEAAYDGLGWSVSMPDPNTIGIGAPYSSTGAYESGYVRIYSWTDSAWVQNGLDIYGEAAQDESGFSVSMPDAHTIGIGARFNDAGATNAGHVRIYSVCSSVGGISPTACNSYASPSGNYTWTASGTYMDTVLNSAGCDSAIIVNLTINTVDLSVTDLSPILISNATNAIYQWLDCNNGMAVINGETAQSFTATVNGDYAVEVTQNGCTDTSACVAVNNIGILQHDLWNALVIHPNPSDDDLMINLGEPCNGVVVIIRNAQGQEVSRRSFGGTDKLRLTLPTEAGVYAIEVVAENKRTVLRAIKE